MVQMNIFSAGNHQHITGDIYTQAGVYIYSGKAHANCSESANVSRPRSSCTLYYDSGKESASVADGSHPGGLISGQSPRQPNLM